MPRAQDLTRCMRGSLELELLALRMAHAAAVIARHSSSAACSRLHAGHAERRGGEVERGGEGSLAEEGGIAPEDACAVELVGLEARHRIAPLQDAIDEP